MQGIALAAVRWTDAVKAIALPWSALSAWLPVALTIPLLRSVRLRNALLERLEFGAKHHVAVVAVSSLQSLNGGSLAGAADLVSAHAAQQTRQSTSTIDGCRWSLTIDKERKHRRPREVVCADVISVPQLHRLILYHPWLPTLTKQLILLRELLLE